MVLYGCAPEDKRVSTENPDLEMQVINDILPELIPEHPPCMVVPIEGEADEEYDKRLQALYDEIDSVGKKVEIVSLLTKLDSNYIEAYKRSEGSAIVKYLLNAPNEDRAIDSTTIEKIRDIRVVLVKEPWSRGYLRDFNILGQFNISRVGFNNDSTKAAFTYFIDDGSCTGGKGGIINAELKDGNWKIIK